MPEADSKWKQVEAAIRKLIVSDQWKVGQKLPTYDELELSFKVSRVTLQQVMRSLKQDGFITSLVRQGLFVSSSPPHLKRVGIVVPRDEGDVRFWKELVLSARAVAEHLGKELVVYRNMESSPEVERQLQHDVDGNLLAGLIFTSPIAQGNPGRAVYEGSSLPKAVFSSAVSAGPVMQFKLNDSLLVSRALDYLQSQGRFKIALFSNIGLRIPAVFDEEIARRKLNSPQSWRFKVALENLDLAGQIACLLTCLPGKERPDAIFISDDNLALSVIKGIASTRFRIPEDIAIISHYNWSVGVRERLPVKSLGYDLKSMISRIFESFEAYRESGALPASLDVAPVFEDELPESQ